MPDLRRLKGLREVIKAIVDLTKATEEIVETVEETVLEPVVEPVKQTINELLLKEYIYQFRIKPQMELAELEEEVKRSLGVEGDIQEYLREFFRSPSSNNRKSNK